MEWTNEQLIETARVVAKYEGEKAAQLLNELATRFDCALAATRTACAQRDALAAENAGLKAAFEKPDAWLSWHSIPPTFYEPDRGGEYLQVHERAGEKNDDGSDSWPVYRNPETGTTATDAFLAEVRASVVDEVCLKISNAIVNCYQDEQIGLDAAATICGDFASLIRKGVQS